MTPSSLRVGAAVPDRPVAVRITIAVDADHPERCGERCRNLGWDTRGGRVCSQFYEKLGAVVVSYRLKLVDGYHAFRCQPCLDAEKEARDGE